MNDLPRTIVEAGEWLRDHRITCTELTEGLLDRAEAAQESLGAFITIVTVDAPTTATSRVLDRAWGAGRDAGVMARLRGSGAIMLGKLVLNEFATGFPDPDTGFPIPKNPWDTTRFPG